MNGLINVYKEKGMTSHDVIYSLRKILEIKKIGHSGTLDPEAEGVLVAGVNKGTKLLKYIGDSFKVYEGELVFGGVSSTEDIHGAVEKVDFDTTGLSKDLIDEVFNGLSGQVIVQKPPMYSSVKVKGKKLYQYARAGLEIDRASKNIEIFKIETLSDIHKNHGHEVIRFKAMVSKGTYVRTLCVHVGDIIGVPSIMGDLLRTEIGNFKISESLKLAEIAKMKEEEDFSFLLPLLTGIDSQVFQLELTNSDYEKIRLGQKIPDYVKAPEGSVFAGIYQGRLTAILTVQNGVLRIIKNIGE